MNITANPILMKELEQAAYEALLQTEDFFCFERQSMRGVLDGLALATSRALERIDEELFRTKSSGMIAKGFERRKILTLFGMVTFKRRRYTYRGENFYLLDEIYGLSKNSSLTASVILFLAKHAVVGSYQSAVDDLYDLSCVKVSRATVKRSIALTAAALIEREAESRPIKERIASLDIESDDISVPLQRTCAQKMRDKKLGKKESGKQHVTLTVAKCYTGKEEIRDTGRKYCVSAHFVTGATGSEDTLERMKDYVEKHFDLERLRYIYFGCDGASNQRIGATILPGKVLDSLDPYHALKKLRELLEVDVYQAITTAIYKKDYSEIRSILTNAFEYYVLTKNHSCIEGLLTAAKYLNKNILLIARGLAHSLGTMEGSLAHVVKDRCKHRGRAWSVQGAENIVALLAAKASGIDLPPVRRKQKGSRLAEVIAISRQRIQIPALPHLNPKGNHYYNQAHVNDCERTKGVNTSSLAA